MKLYIRLSGSQNSYYSNDFVFKGKPFVYEFKIASNSTTATDIAKEIKRVIDKIQAFYGDKYIKTEVAGDKLTIHGVDEYQQLYRDWETDRKSTRLNSSHEIPSRMPSSA